MSQVVVCPLFICWSFCCLVWVFLPVNGNITYMYFSYQRFPRQTLQKVQKLPSIFQICEHVLNWGLPTLWKKQKQ